MTDDDDPIEELHKIRKAMYAEAGGTPSGFVKYLRSMEKRQAGKLLKRTGASQIGKTKTRRKAVRS